MYDQYYMNYALRQVSYSPPKPQTPPLYPSTNVFCRYTLHIRQAKRSCMERTCFLIDPSAKVFGMSNKVAPEPEKVTDEELLLASTDEDPKKKELVYSDMVK